MRSSRSSRHRPVWESNFGRLTPSTRRRPRNAAARNLTHWLISTQANTEADEKRQEELEERIEKAVDELEVASEKRANELASTDLSRGIRATLPCEDEEVSGRWSTARRLSHCVQSRTDPDPLFRRIPVEESWLQPAVQPFEGLEDQRRRVQLREPRERRVLRALARRALPAQAGQ